MKYTLPLVAAILCFLWFFAIGHTATLAPALPDLGPLFHPARGIWVNAGSPRLLRSEVIERSLDHPLAGGSVFFDDRGVPHIFADSATQAYFLQGYLHAADRLWQMDISTRATEGTLSEVLGARTQVRDVDQRAKGYHRAARREAAVTARDFPADQAVLEAYSAGVNAYVAGLSAEELPVEYKLLGHRPLRWSPYRTMLFLKGMGQSLSSRYSDMEHRRTLDTLGTERYADLFPKRYGTESPVVPDDGQYPNARTVKETLARLSQNTLSYHRSSTGRGTAPATPGTGDRAPASCPRSAVAQTDASFLVSTDPEAYELMPPHPDNGSNNWAVNARHGNTGYPLLASDPHLALTLPSIWYEVQLHFPGVNARGVSLPGAPGIAMGFNDHVAFGETNVGHDVTDWFRIDWTDSTRTAYRLDGEIVAAETLLDTISIKNAPPVIQAIPLTIFGPVPYTEGPYANHAFRYLGHRVYGAEHRPHSAIGVFLRLLSAENYQDYEQALRGWVDPAQNFVYADRHGEIAMRPSGFFPVRASGDGSLPYPGDSRAYNWRGYVPFEQRPVHRNPDRGFVASANQITTGPNYPYAYSGGFADYRGRYINRRLTKQRVLNQRQMKELQLSSYSLFAEELQPLLLARINRASLNGRGMDLFRLAADWDYVYAADSRAATLFERWYKRVYQLTFNDELPPDNDLARPELRRLTELLRNQPQHTVFDDSSTPNFRETAATITQRAFDEILEELEENTLTAWAEERNTRVAHLGRIPGFGSGLIRSPGARFVPRTLSSGNGASWRMVVEVGKFPRAWGSLPGGASGRAGSPFYSNGLNEWAEGRYHELVRWRDWEEAEKKATGRWDFVLAR